MAAGLREQLKTTWRGVEQETPLPLNSLKGYLQDIFKNDKVTNYPISFSCRPSQAKTYALLANQIELAKELDNMALDSWVQVVLK